MKHECLECRGQLIKTESGIVCMNCGIVSNQINEKPTIQLIKAENSYGNHYASISEKPSNKKTSGSYRKKILSDTKETLSNTDEKKIQKLKERIGQEEVDFPMKKNSCLLNTYYYDGLSKRPDNYDYTHYLEQNKSKIWKMDILSTDFLVNIKDIKLFIEELMHKLITLCIEIEDEFIKEFNIEPSPKHTRKEILEDILIPFFFNMFECKTRGFTFTYIKWFPTKKSQVREIAKIHTRLKMVDSEFQYYTKEIMQTHYPEIYQFYKDMAEWEEYAQYDTKDCYRDETSEGRYEFDYIVKRNREKYSLIREPNESSFDFLVRIIEIFDNLDPYPDHPMLINFVGAFEGFFYTEICGY